MDWNRFLQGTLAVAEAALALSAAVALTLLLTVPFVAVDVRLEWELRPSGPAAAPRLTHEQLRARAAALVPEGRVEVVLQEGASHLVLARTADRAAAEGAVAELLERSGYLAVAPRERPVLDLEAVLEGDPRVLPALLGIQSAVFLLAGWTLARWRLRETALPGAAPLRAILFGLGGGMAILVVNVLMTLALNAVGLPVHEQPWIRDLLSRPNALMLAAPLVVLLGPLAEEVFFRGYVFRWMRQNSSFPTALLVSSVMFAAIHFNLSGFLIYVMIGCVLAWVHERTGSLLAPIVGHVTANALVLITSLALLDG